MPIYEYECRSCGHRLEAIQKMSDPVLQQCPTCGQNELKKRISAAGFQLKGNGWYVTDFKKNGGKDKSKQDNSEKSESSSNTSSEKKATGGCGHGGCGCAH